MAEPWKGNTSMSRTILVTALSLSLLGLAACGRGDDSPKVKTGINNNGTQTISVTDGKGTQVTVAGSGAPANMPEFAPLFPGATVESTVTTPEKGGMVAFKTTATRRAVIDYYKKSAAAAGFQDSFNLTTGDTISYSAASEKPEHSLNVTAAKSEDGTQVQVVWN